MDYSNAQGPQNMHVRCNSITLRSLACFKTLLCCSPVIFRNPATVLAAADPTVLIPIASSGYSSFVLRWAVCPVFWMPEGNTRSGPGRCICSPPLRPTCPGSRRSPAGRTLGAPYRTSRGPWPFRPTMDQMCTSSSGGRTRETDHMGRIAHDG